MTSTQQTPALLKPIKVGKIALQHRVVLAPMTRFRAYASHVPGPQQASYYSQRASTAGSLLITEGTFISHDAGGYAHVPGIYTDAQIQGWKKVRPWLLSLFLVSLCLTRACVRVIVDHGCCPCQGIVHFPSVGSTGSCCRYRFP